MIHVSTINNRISSVYLIVALLTLSVICDDYYISSYSINIPYHAYQFNTQNSDLIYICMPYLQGNTNIIAYLMRDGSNIFNIQNTSQRITFFDSKNVRPNHCDSQNNRTNTILTKNTKYYIVVDIYEGNFVESFKYTVRVGSALYKKDFNGTFYNNGMYYSKTIPYQPCLNNYIIQFVSKSQTAPAITAKISRTSKSPQSYLITQQSTNIPVNNIIQNQVISYQLQYDQLNYKLIYAYNVSMFVSISNPSQTITCCRQQASTKLCHKLNIKLSPTLPPPTLTPTPIGAIIGGIIGGIVFIILIILLIYYMYKRPKYEQKAIETPGDGTDTSLPQNPNPQILICNACEKVEEGCDLRCGSCKIYFHSYCMENWIKNGGKCPNADCQMSNFQYIITKM